MQKIFTRSFPLVVSAAFCVLMIGSLALGQTQYGSRVAEAVARNIYFLVTPTVSSSNGTIESENKTAQTEIDDSISGNTNENALGILSPQADQFFAGDGSPLTALKWGTTAAGPFTSAFTSGNTANFATVNGTGAGAGGITVNGIVATENFTYSAPTGTLATGGTVAPITVSSGKTLNLSSLGFSTAAGTGFSKNGAGTFFSSNGNAYPGGFTLNAGTVVAGGVNALGSGGALTINGGTIAGSGTRDFSAKFGGGINIAGDFQLGALASAISLSSDAANLTFSNTVALGAATRIITIGANGVYTLGGIISGASGSGLTIARLAGATGRVSLTGVNTYTGNTTINSGILALTTGGSIANSPNIIIAGGATFDVSGRTTTLTLASGQGLTASGTTSTGTITTAATRGLTTAANSPLNFTAFNGTTAPLTISGAGTITLQSGNVVTVTVANGGTPLATGSYTLISKGASGAVAGTAPTSLTVNGDGIAAGNGAELQIINGNLVLAVAPPPTLGTYSNTSVVLSGNVTVTPSAAPTNAASISASTDSNFKGTLAVNPTTGVVTITDAHPAGTYIVTVRAFSAGSTTTQTFTLTVTSGTACAGTTAFTGATDVSVGSSPFSVAIGDFNNDGKQDFAAANGSSAASVSIRLGDGLGGFSGATNVGVGISPVSVAIGDFNADGKQDFASANLGSNSVSIRLGDGLGGFTGTTNVIVGTEPFSVAIGDFNADGKQDFAAANAGSATVSIRLGNGLGGFSGVTEVVVGSIPRSVAIGDFNNDGKQDFAAANAGSATVSIRLGDGLGGFSVTTEVGVGSDSRSVAIGDFNADGKQDFAAANLGSNTVSIRLGDGLGGFSGTTEVIVGTNLQSVAIGDFNNDGKQDLAAVSSGSNTVSIRLGDGMGGFSGTMEVGVGSGSASVAIGDFNSDGKQDFATANNGSGANSVSIRLGACVLPQEINVKGNNVDIASGDTTPAAADHTDFGSVTTGSNLSRTFTIENTGTVALNLTGTPIVAVSGANMSEFTVTTQPTTPVAASGTTTFTVQFAPTATGLRTATISIVNDDADENPYTFAIQGTGVAPNNPPTIAATTGVSIVKGTTQTGVTIATVTDDGGNGNVTVTVTSQNPSNGITLSNITNTNGTITANITATCAATNASFTLSASDGVNPAQTATLNVGAIDSTAATQLAFTQQPSNTNSGAVIAPAVTVSALNACGGVVTGFGDSVAVTLNGAGGTLGGTTTVTAMNGVATFSNLTVTTGTTGSFTLSATSGVLTGATSNSFTVTVPQPGTIQFNPTTYPNQAESGTASLTVTRTGGTDGAVSATYTITNGTAMGGTCGAGGADFDNSSSGGTVTFAAGSSTSQTISVPICDDAIAEANETFTVTLSAPTGGATIGGATATVTITNDDTAGVDVFPATVNVTEGGSTGLITVRLNSQPTADVTINISSDSQVTVTAAACPNFINDQRSMQPAAIQLVFTPANYNTRQCVQVTAVDDAAVEGNHTGTISLSAASSDPNYNGIQIPSVTANITDNDVPTVTLSQPACGGISGSTLFAGFRNYRLLCFTLTSNTTNSFTALTVQFTNDPSVRFTNARLFRSTDTDYDTMGDNTLVTTGTINTTSFQFSGFSQRTEGEAFIPFAPELAIGANNFFIVADVLQGLNTMTPPTQPSVSPSDVTVTGVMTSGTTATGMNYTFAPPPPTAAVVTAGGRIVNNNGRAVARAQVTMTDGAGNIRTAMTNPQGYYRFTDVEVGQTILVTARAKGYLFPEPARVVSLNDETLDINFTAYPSGEVER